MDRAQEFIDKMLELAASFVGIKEVGNNGGPEVEEFQRAVDGRAQHESWCMCVQQAIVKKVEAAMGVFLSKLKRTEHCLTYLNHACANGYGWRLTDPGRPRIQRGDHLIFQHGYTTAGHVALSRDDEAPTMKTYEGNTSSNDAGSQSNGDGFYPKLRHLKGPVNKFHMVGFVRPVLAGMIDAPKA